MRFTIFTPTFNRAHTLPRLYESIRRQTVREFEWIVVDDGSTDGTDKLVREWQLSNNDFPIRYYWQPNQHKKVAFNRGVREARHEWFVQIDSDDELLPDTLEQFQKMWETIPLEHRHKYCAVVGLCVDSEGRTIGDRFPSEPLDASSVELYFDYNIKGEKFSCLRTEVLREYPFPEDISDLVPENVIWFRISRKYTQRCFNVPVRIYHRDVESLTLPANPLLVRRRRSQGAVLSYAEALDCMTVRRCLRAPMKMVFLAIQHGHFSYYLPAGVMTVWPKKKTMRIIALLFKPLGYCLYLMDHWGFSEKLRDVLTRLGLRFY